MKLGAKLKGRHTDPKPNGTAKIKTSLLPNIVSTVATIIELEALIVLREWYRAKQAKDRIKEREKAEARFKEGFEKGIERGRQLEREEQAARRDKNNRNGKHEN